MWNQWFWHWLWTCCYFQPNQDTIGWEHFIRGRMSHSFSPIVASYHYDNKISHRFTSQKWYSSVIVALFDIHQQAWIEFCSTTTRKSSTKNIASPKKTLPRLVENYYSLSTSLQKLQRQWFARSISSFSSWTVDNLCTWLRTTKRILRKN